MLTIWGTSNEKRKPRPIFCFSFRRQGNKKSKLRKSDLKYTSLLFSASSLQCAEITAVRSCKAETENNLPGMVPTPTGIASWAAAALRAGMRFGIVSLGRGGGSLAAGALAASDTWRNGFGFSRLKLTNPASLPRMGRFSAGIRRRKQIFAQQRRVRQKVGTESSINYSNDSLRQIIRWSRRGLSSLRFYGTNGRRPPGCYWCGHARANKTMLA